MSVLYTCIAVLTTRCCTVEINTTITTNIDGVVCPPNISETVAGRLLKLAHRQRIASTTIKSIKEKKLLSILSILVKTIQRIVADPGSGKTIQPIRIYIYESRCSPNHVTRGHVSKVETIHTVPSHGLNASLLYTRFLHGVNVKC